MQNDIQGQIWDLLKTQLPADVQAELSIEERDAFVTLDIGDPKRAKEYEPLREHIEAGLKDIVKDRVLHVMLTADRKAPEIKPQKTQGQPQSTAQPPVRENIKPKHIKRIIAVASGKGGVGKSTIAANLARALSSQGLKVGLMDADIYGPSQPTLFGVADRKADMQDKKVIPIMAEGIALVSIGFLVDQSQPMIWRGPMIQSAIRQFFQDVNWPELDILVVDMPPGTGDAQLTFAQKVPLDGAIIVSTPQDLAFIDARRGIEMFRQTGVPILGLVENMSHVTCDKCGHETHIWGDQTLEKKTKDAGVNYLASLPLSPAIINAAENGQAPEDMDAFDRLAKILLP